MPQVGLKDVIYSWLPVLWHVGECCRCTLAVLVESCEERTRVYRVHFSSSEIYSMDYAQSRRNYGVGRPEGDSLVLIPDSFEPSASYFPWLTPDGRLTMQLLGVSATIRVERKKVPIRRFHRDGRLVVHRIFGGMTPTASMIKHI